MRAVVYGAKAGAFPLVTRPVPVPSSSQLRVRVHAAALNPLDYKLPSMLPFFLRWQLRGKGVSFDFAGVVDAVGADVRGFSVGDRVFGFATSGGALAEFTLTGANEVATLPAAVSYAAAASLPGSGLTSAGAAPGGRDEHDQPGDFRRERRLRLAGRAVCKGAGGAKGRGRV